MLAKKIKFSRVITPLRFFASRVRGIDCIVVWFPRCGSYRTDEWEHLAQHRRVVVPSVKSELICVVVRQSLIDREKKVQTYQSGGRREKGRRRSLGRMLVPLIRQIEDRWIARIVVRVKRSSMLLSWFLSCFGSRVRVSRLYTYRNRPRVKPVLRLEDRERIEHLVLSAHAASSRAKWFTPITLHCIFPAARCFPPSPWIQSCDPFGISVRLTVSLVSIAFIPRRRDRSTLGRSSCSSRVPKCFETSSRRSLARRFLAAKCFLAWHSVLHRRGTTEWNVTMSLGHLCPATCWSPRFFTPTVNYLKISDDESSFLRNDSHCDA